VKHLLLAAPLVLTLTGCMSGSDFAGRAVEHNRAIAEASDQLMLLNIVRAKYDRPIVYSQFGGVSEGFTNSFGLSLSGPFGADAASEYGAAAAAGPEQYVSLSTGPLDDVDFYQGVMRPIQIGLLAYYLDQGWPRDLLFSLTMEKLDISEAFHARVVRESDARCAAGHMAFACAYIAGTAGRLPAPDRGRLVFYNDPRTADLFDPFHNLLLRLVVLGITIDGSFLVQDLRVPAATMITATSAEIQKLQLMGTKVTRSGGDYIITTSTWVPGLRLRELGNTNVRVEGDPDSGAAVDLIASLRSPDSILFYLGAYARDGGANANVMIGRPGQERFVPVFELGPCDGAVVTVDFDSACYGIPDDGDHVSMKVMAFLHQVFGLNKKAIEPPAPGTIRTVN
jgi:hypothetical protein